MTSTSLFRLSTIVFVLIFSAWQTTQAQSVGARQVLTYHEIKDIIGVQKSTVDNMLALKRFVQAGEKVRPDATIYVYEKPAPNAMQVLVRVQKSDDRVTEFAWHEPNSTLGILKYDAVHDGFVPVSGYTGYQNRFQQRALLLNYELEKSETIPCVLRQLEQ